MPPGFKIHHVIDDSVYIAQGVDELPHHSFRRFVTNDIQYQPFCDDFGPMSLSSVICFIDKLRDEMQTYPDSRIVYCIDEGMRSLTNAVFLLGSFMMIVLNMPAAEVSDRFDWLTEDICEQYRDATYTDADFRLGLEDCWRGLERAQALGWFKDSHDGEEWGCINIAEYRHYDHPANGDFHEVVPGRMVAFRGPYDLDGAIYRDDEAGLRSFSPAYFAEIFASDYNVKAVVRLNHIHYDPTAFRLAGICHHDLPFPDCSPSPANIVAAFLAIADNAIAQGGAVAVYCRAGLGRTGTLIALYMMRSLGFSARAAMGWLRMVRPGSVIGSQQHFLCAVEGKCDGVMGWLTGGGKNGVGRQGERREEDRRGADQGVREAGERARVGEAVATGMERRLALRMQSSRRPA